MRTLNFQLTKLLKKINCIKLQRKLSLFSLWIWFLLSGRKLTEFLLDVIIHKFSMTRHSSYLLYIVSREPAGNSLIWFCFLYFSIVKIEITSTAQPTLPGTPPSPEKVSPSVATPILYADSPDLGFESSSRSAAPFNSPEPSPPTETAYSFSPRRSPRLLEKGVITPPYPAGGSPRRLPQSKPKSRRVLLDVPNRGQDPRGVSRNAEQTLPSSSVHLSADTSGDIHLIPQSMGASECIICWW